MATTETIGLRALLIGVGQHVENQRIALVTEPKNLDFTLKN